MYVPMGFDSDPRTPIPSLVDPPERTAYRDSETVRTPGTAAIRSTARS